MSMKDAGCVYFYIMLLNASVVYCNLKSWQVSPRNSWQAKPFVRSKHFDLQNLLPKLEGCRAHGIFLNVPAVLGWDHSLLASKKNDWGQCSWVLKNHWKTSSENPGPILVIGYPMVFIVIGLQAFFILKTSLLKCQLHSTKNPQVASGFLWIFVGGLRVFTLTLTFSGFGTRWSWTTAWTGGRGHNFNPSWRNSSKWNHGESKEKTLTTWLTWYYGLKSTWIWWHT